MSLTHKSVQSENLKSNNTTVVTLSEKYEYEERPKGRPSRS